MCTKNDFDPKGAWQAPTPADYHRINQKAIEFATANKLQRPRRCEELLALLGMCTRHLQDTRETDREALAFGRRFFHDPQDSYVFFWGKIYPLTLWNEVVSEAVGLRQRKDGSFSTACFRADSDASFTTYLTNKFKFRQADYFRRRAAEAKRREKDANRPIKQRTAEKYGNGETVLLLARLTRDKMRIPRAPKATLWMRLFYSFQLINFTRFGDRAYAALTCLEDILLEPLQQEYTCRMTQAGEVYEITQLIEADLSAYARQKALCRLDAELQLWFLLEKSISDYMGCSTANVTQHKNQIFGALLEQFRNAGPKHF